MRNTREHTTPIIPNKLAAPVNEIFIGIFSVIGSLLSIGCNIYPLSQLRQVHHAVILVK